MLNWDEVRHQSQSAYKTDARAVQQKKQAKANSPSSIDWNRVYYVPNILKFQESERQEAAKRQKLMEAKKAAEQAQSEQTQALGTIIAPIDPSIEQARQAAEQLKKQWDNRYKLQRPAAAKAAEPQKTPIDQRIRIGPESAYGSTIGMNIIPAYEEDPTLAKIGKGIVNYGIGGALSLFGNIMGAPQQAMMQTVTNVDKAIRGQPLDFSEKTLRKDILPAEYDKALSDLSKKGKLGEAASTGIDMVVNMALDPMTYVGGGILDDLSRAGLYGKGATPGTQEYFDAYARIGDKMAKQSAKQAAKTVDDIPPIGGKTTADSIDDQVKKLDDYFQQKRTAPIDGEPISQPLELPDLPVRYNPNLKNEASNKGVHIEVGDKFYKLSPEQQKTILVHENAHNIADEYLFKQRHFEEIMNNKAFGETKTAPNGRTYWEGIFGDVGPDSVVETFTEAIAVYKRNPQWLQERHPQVYEYIKNNVVKGLSAQQGFAPIGGESARNVAKSADIPPIGGRIETTRTGDAIWKNKDFDQPVKVTGFAGEYGGRKYVNIEGSSTAIPLDEIEFAPIGGKVETPQARIYGEQPKGEIPEGMKERGFSRNIRTDTAMPDDIRQMFDDDPLFYKQVSNKETLGKAQTIFSKGEEAATAEFYRLINDKKYHAEAIPLSKLLAEQALENGNITKAREILSEAADKLTDAGRTAQAAKILREADPETFLMTIDKQLRKLNEQGLKQYGKKWTNIDLLPDEITAIQNIPRGNQQAYEEVWEQIGNRIAKELPSTKMEKFDAWRRMAMLLNPKTHIRNVGGNVIMMGMRKASDTIGAALEKLFGVKERTKSFGWSFNKNIASKVDETWEAVKKDILGESRWKIDNLKSLGQEKRIFKKGLPTKAVEAITGHKFDRGALQWLNEFSLKTLNAEDNIFTQRAFKDALGQFMQANKLTEATDAAIEYARRRALEATFKQANELASTLNRWKRIPVVGKFVEGAVPFTKTPANIIMRGIEYSPGGLLKALYDVKAGKTAAQAIEDLSKGLTGTGIMILGYYLGSSGWAKVERHRSKKAEGLYQSLGDQAYAINTPYGSYTFDWAQPFSIPLAMGIAVAETIKSRKDSDTMLQAIWDGIAAGGDTIFNMTMLQNIREILGSYGSPTEKIMGIPLDYLEQAVFSVFGQAARTIDPIRRSTYDPNAFRQWTKGIQARIPGLSQWLEPALDIWGQEQYHGGALQQFISPGYYKAKSDDPVTLEVARLHGEFQDNDMLPKVAPRSFTHKGEKYELTAQQVTEFQRKMGQENYSDIARLISSAEYQRMTDEEKVKKIKKIVNDNYEEAKQDIIKASALKGN